MSEPKRTDRADAEEATVSNMTRGDFEDDQNRESPGGEPSGQEHHNPETDEDTASGGSAER
ncbi:MAG: hypothetical protein JWP70_855 [Leifsonia sp.]|jgi:hypothetical protein|nr:hypothetical protein [Leifsonia sp.]MDQ1588048.1 hypothetical protein [Microbacteriaceae bacterium]